MPRFLCPRADRQLRTAAARATLTDFEAETLPGVFLGQRQVPVSSVGAYPPGGPGADARQEATATMRLERVRSGW